MASVTLKSTLTLEGAKLVAGAAVAEAQRRAIAVTIAVADIGGHLLYLERMDGAPAASPDNATAKARTCALFGGIATNDLDEMTARRPGMLNLPGIVPVQGGLPLRFSDQLVGAIGVSGADPVDDDRVAERGVDALTHS